MSPTDKNLAIGVTIAAVVIFAASFMPWGEIRGLPDIPFLQPGETGANLLGGLEFVMTITGWNGSITPARVKLPNWLVVFAAIGVASLCWLKARSVWPAPTALLFGLAGYGLLHAGYALIVLLGSSKGSAGVGSFLTVIGFASILVALVRHARKAKPTAWPSQP